MSKTKNEMALVPVKLASAGAKTVKLSLSNLSMNGDPKRRRRSKANRRSQGPRSLSDFNVSGSYASCLNDPFNVDPMPLGLGTMIPTETTTAWCRSFFTCNGDGSFCIVINPSCCRVVGAGGTGGFVAINNAAATSAGTWTTTFNPSDRSSLQADFDQLRVISGGLRVYPIVASTVAPGAIYAGNVAPTSITSGSPSVPGSTLSPLSTADITAFPSMELVVGNDPVEVVWRPSELSDYDFGAFNAVPVQATVAGEQVPVLVVAGTGFPGAATMVFDSVFHYEGYNSQLSASSAASIGYNSQSTTQRPVSIDSLWEKAKRFLTPAVNLIGNAAQGVVQNYVKTLTGRYLGANHSGGRLIPYSGSSAMVRRPAVVHSARRLMTYNAVSESSKISVVQHDDEEHKDDSSPPTFSAGPSTFVSPASSHAATPSRKRI